MAEPEVDSHRPPLVKEFVWDDKPRALKDLISTGRLPFTVKLHQGDLGKYVPTNPSGEAAVPGVEQSEDVFHVLETRRRKVVLARRMQWERKSEDYARTGTQIEIPAAYKGWFEILPDDGRPVEYFDTIHAITGIKPRRFLVRTSTVGYQLIVEQEGSSWVPYEIRPGEVLSTGIVFMDQKKKPSNMKKFFRRILKHGKGHKREQDLKYLQCFDSSGKEIMIPLIMSGVFSPVGDHSDGNYDAVYELQDLILAFHLPVKSQIIHSENKSQQSVPNGVLLLESVKEEECILIGRFPFDPSKDSTYELPLKCDVTFLKDVAKRKKAHKKGASDEINDVVPENVIYANSEVVLPVRVRDGSKKAKGPSLLEKLSVRSKAKKERATLKALQEQGVFCSRLSKSEVSMNTFFKDSDETLVKDDGDESQNSNAENSSQVVNTQSVDGSREQNEGKVGKRDTCNYAVVSKVKTHPNVDRDLPPIPKIGEKTDPLESPSRHCQHGRDPVYEELPVAPKPPSQINVRQNSLDDHHDNDGYMVPANLRNPYAAYMTPDGAVRRKPPTVPRDAFKFARARKARSEMPVDFGEYGEGCPLDIDELFDFSPTSPDGRENIYNGQGYVYNPSWVESRVPQRYRNRTRPNHTFADDLDIQTRPLTGWAKLRSRSSKNLNVDANVTLRSQNMRKIPSAMEVFQFSDSFRDVRQQGVGKEYQENGPGPQNPYAAYQQAVEGERMNPYLPNETYDRNFAYAESEPGAYKRYHRSMSMAGLSDPCFKQGDDSAISMCSKGDYGYQGGESEYSYSEYQEFRDDGFTPPDDIYNLTVPEVSKSLRYIGMKDRVTIRFAHEQIDGNMLKSLDKTLLKEGFPELNALEIKKIMDFIGGWRPKK